MNLPKNLRKFKKVENQINIKMTKSKQTSRLSDRVLLQRDLLKIKCQNNRGFGVLGFWGFGKDSGSN